MLSCVFSHQVLTVFLISLALGGNALGSKLYWALRSARSNRVKERDTTENVESRLVTRTSFLRH
jgi:hypothetical protein